ncbi:glycosyl hydrolase family protein [Streptococcus minor]|uniref:Glycosyl hydrolase family protein n=1 Tax=Streptococcus minor TaxID=229549 RepID=A0A3P1VAN5_9STRE|nr:family 1 glycosylhydrolase [Streptococcus minor]RRD31284.1 glycosyl hydrolase family protein [Streptococcus minor]
MMTVWTTTALLSAMTGEMRKRDSISMVIWTTLERTPKDSFYWYKKVIANNGEDLE